MYQKECFCEGARHNNSERGFAFPGRQACRRAHNQEQEPGFRIPSEQVSFRLQAADCAHACRRKKKGKPVIQLAMEEIHSYNVNNFIVYADSFAREIMLEMQPRKLPFSVDFLSPEKPTGTIKPLLMAKSSLKDTFLVAYADTIASININDMLSFHRKNNALATMALTTVSNPKDFGVAVLQGNKITEFSEKPKSAAHSYLINAGYFLFEPEIFKFLSKGMQSIEKDLFPKLAEKGLLFGYPFQGKYFNINTKKDFEAAAALL